MGSLGGTPRHISGCYHGVSRQEKQNTGKVLIVVHAEYPGPDGEATKRQRRAGYPRLRTAFNKF